MAFILWNKPQHDSEEADKTFERITAANTAKLNWKEQLQYKVKRPLGFQNSTVRKQTEKTTQMQNFMIYFMKKEEWLKGRTKTQRAKPETLKNYSQAFWYNQGNSNVCPPKFQNHYGPVTPLCLSFSHFWTGKSIAIILYLSHQCMLGV